MEKPGKPHGKPPLKKKEKDPEEEELKKRKKKNNKKNRTSVVPDGSTCAKADDGIVLGTFDKLLMEEKGKTQLSSSEKI